MVSMNPKDIERFVMRYLQTLQCTTIEKTPYSATVKLSPEADKELTNRPYYWSFVERTNAEPETMTYKFIFEPAKEKAAAAAPTDMNSSGETEESAGSSILAKYLGFTPTRIASRIPENIMTFGSQRLEQIFQSARNRGRFVRLFEDPPQRIRSAQPPIYESWLCLNYKVEFVCDLKRSEVHSLGFHLSTGEIREGFYEHLLARKLTPRLPAGIALQRDRYTLTKAASSLETHLIGKIKTYNHSWSEFANEKLQEEIERLQSYYENLLQRTEMNEREAVQLQYRNRMEEMEWQYRPRIHVFAINCGLFHLCENRLSSSFIN